MPRDSLRVPGFEEALVPSGVAPGPAETRDLESALKRHAGRENPDDFSNVTEFLRSHPASAWRGSLELNLGLEYYKSAHYSLALAAWREAWALLEECPEVAGKFLGDRAVCELATMYARLGRMSELEALLESVEKRAFYGGATERINMAREALSMMKHQPEVSFRCGPLALQSIKRSIDPNALVDMAIVNSASTQQGFSLEQVAELSMKIGLKYQMAFREEEGAFVVPSVVHWKVGHYAALVRQVDDRYLLEDPTFGNTVWATKEALQSETSGYFLIPRGELERGWRSVEAKEGSAVWGKGVTSGNDGDIYTPDDLQTGETCSAGDGLGMAVSRAHLMLVNLQISDTPVGYRPPVGPAVQFTIRYNHRDYLQPPSMISSVLGPKWTHDWNAYIRDDPNRPLADAKYLVGGGGARTFTGFNTNTHTFAPQQYDLTQLKRIGTNTFTSSYEMTFPDGSRKVFGQRTPDGSVFLTQVVDPAGNAVTLTWQDTGILGRRLLTLTDAIGQVTTLSYEHPLQSLLITKVTDPFGRFASFEYRSVEIDADSNPNSAPITVYVLAKSTDVLGLVSQFDYVGNTDIVQRMITPYGTTTFTVGQGGGPGGTTRWLETLYPDGSRDRVEYNQNTNGLAFSEPAHKVPTGVAVFNQ